MSQSDDLRKITSGVSATVLAHEHTGRLLVHAETPTDAVQRIDARLLRSSDGTLAVVYSITGDTERLLIPEPGTSAIAEGLWKHTCCELFVKGAGRAGYHELNFAPSRQWAAYAFAGYREARTAMNASVDPQISVARSSGGLELRASLPLARLSPSYVRAALLVSVTAVVEDIGGGLSYWALAHPPGKPDFHHSDAFALVLDEVRN